MSRFGWELDSLLAVTGTFLGFLLLIIAVLLKMGIGLSLTLLVSSLSYMVFKFYSRNRSEKSHIAVKNDFSSMRNAYFFSFLLSIFIFMILISSSYLFKDAYARPPLYFILVAVLSVAIILEIHIFSTFLRKNIIIYNILFQILALSSSIIISGIVVFEIGSDQWVHAHFIDSIIYAGTVPKGDPYSNFAFMHVGAAITSIITSLPPHRESIIAFVGVFYSMGLVIIFLIGRDLFGTKTALLSSLLLGINM